MRCERCGAPLGNRIIKINGVVYCENCIRELGFAVKLDTNGTNPAMLRGLIEDGLVDYVAMDIKSSPERYAAVAGR